MIPIETQFYLLLSFILYLPLEQSIILLTIYVFFCMDQIEYCLLQ